MEVEWRTDSAKTCLRQAFGKEGVRGLICPELANYPVGMLPGPGPGLAVPTAGKKGFVGA